jgi:cell division transport system permease protein
MFGTNAKRIWKAGFVNFWRNGVVSLASVLVFTVTLFVIGGLLVGNALLGAILTDLKDKVDVTVYFTLDADAQAVSRLVKQVEALPEVKSAEYLSSEDVLVAFKKAHENDSLILQSINELEGQNPLPAELNIRANDPSQYTTIVNYLNNESLISQNGGTKGIVDKINYDDNKVAIDRFSELSISAEQIGLYVGIISALIAILVAFNTIRIAIYSSREEIGVMRLVGADDSYIRGPFIVEGIIYGIAGTVISLVLLFPLMRWVSVVTRNFYGVLDLGHYYITNFPIIFAIVLGFGVLMGIFSSILAVRKYLRL